MFDQRSPVLQLRGSAYSPKRSNHGHWKISGYFLINYSGKILVKKYFKEFDETSPKISLASQSNNFLRSYSRVCPVWIKILQ